MLYCISGIAPQVNLRANSADINTLETALCTRMYTCEVDGEYIEPPLPSRTMVAERMKNFKRKLCTFHSSPETPQQVVEYYSGSKRRVYEQACLTLLGSPVNRRDAESVSFVKLEKVPPNKAPRCIQPRNPRYNLELGRYIKHIEHRLYKQVAKVFGDGPTIMKGYNVQEIGRIINGKWNTFKEPVAVGLDATKFDMHVSPAMLSWEHSVYTTIFRNDPHLRKLLRWQMHNVGRGYCADGKLKYSVTGKRFSGDMNTALGNCLIMCGMIHAYLEARGIKGKLVNNGDDCVVFLEQADLAEFQRGLEEWFLEVGFRMVAELPVFSIQEIEFCQMHPIKTVNGWTMVRNIPKAMAKDALCLLPIRNQKELQEWMGAVGECGMSITKGVPVLSAFYAAYARNGTNKTRFGESLFMNSGVRFLRTGHLSQEEEITDESRYNVWKAWGILPDHQVALEQYFSTMVVEYSKEVASDYSTVPSLLM